MQCHRDHSLSCNKGVIMNTSISWSRPVWGDHLSMVVWARASPQQTLTGPSQGHVGQVRAGPVLWGPYTCLGFGLHFQWANSPRPTRVGPLLWANGGGEGPGQACLLGCCQLEQLRAWYSLPMELPLDLLIKKQHHCLEFSILCSFFISNSFTFTPHWGAVVMLHAL